jgi:hypothetical protein
MAMGKLSILPPFVRSWLMRVRTSPLVGSSTTAQLVSAQTHVRRALASGCRGVAGAIPCHHRYYPPTYPLPGGGERVLPPPRRLRRRWTGTRRMRRRRRVMILRGSPRMARAWGHTRHDGTCGSFADAEAPGAGRPRRLLLPPDHVQGVRTACRVMQAAGAQAARPVPGIPHLCIAVAKCPATRRAINLSAA